MTWNCLLQVLHLRLGLHFQAAQFFHLEGPRYQASKAGAGLAHIRQPHSGLSEQTVPLAPGPHPEDAPSWTPEPPSPSATGSRCRRAGTPRPGLPVAAPAAASPVQDSASCTGTRWLCAENGGRSLITVGPSGPGCSPGAFHRSLFSPQEWL